MLCFATAASTTRRSGIVAAADKDQARILRDACATWVSQNEWTRQLVQVQADKLVSPVTGTTTTFISSDVASSWGHLADWILCDEWTHWPNSGLWESLYSTAAKRGTCYLQIQSNAGTAGSWQEPVHQAIWSDPDWHVSELDGPKASWISKRQLAAQERILPDVVFRRVWQNEWTSGLDSALSEEAIERAITLAGPVCAS